MPLVKLRSAFIGSRASILVVAILVRLLVGVAATGRGEMEGLAPRYLNDALAIAAGYGLYRPVETAPPQVDLIALAGKLAREGRTITPHDVPAIDAERWRPSGLHPPAYAFWLSGIYRLVGFDAVLPVARALQGLLDALAALVVLAIGRRIAGRITGLVGGWGYALFLPAAYIATSRVADAFLPAAIIGVSYLWIRAVERHALSWSAAAGLALGLTCLVRPDFLLYPVALAGASWALSAGRRLRSLAGSAALVATMLVVLLPWGMRNRSVYGEFKLTTNAAGMTLLQSIGQFPNPYGLPVPDAGYYDLARRAGYDGIDDPAVDRMFRLQFFRIARENPGLLVRQAMARLPMGLVPLYRWGYENRYYAAGHSFYDVLEHEGLSAYELVSRRPGEVVRAYWDRLLFGVFSLLLLGATVAVAWIHRRAPAQVLALVLPWLYVVVSHLCIYLTARFLVPAAFCSLLALGVLVAAILAPGKERLRFGAPVAPES